MTMLSRGIPQLIEHLVKKNFRVWATTGISRYGVGINNPVMHNAMPVAQMIPKYTAIDALLEHGFRAAVTNIFPLFFIVLTH
jgi:hypothetical protein